MATSDIITPEQLLLRAIMQTMKPKQRDRIVELIGDVIPDNLVRLRSPVSTADRNALVQKTRNIMGQS